MSGKHIELFLVDGTPGGLTTAEIMNWTGHVLSARRSDMSALMRRKEVTGTCVYLLLGEGADGSVRCYIGETDDFPGDCASTTAIRTSGTGSSWSPPRTRT